MPSPARRKDGCYEHPTQINLWKKQLLEGAEEVFLDGRTKQPAVASDEPEAAELYEQIGRLKVQLECLKKKWPKTVHEARQWIDFDHEQLSVREQCRLTGRRSAMLASDSRPTAAPVERFVIWWFSL